MKNLMSFSAFWRVDYTIKLGDIMHDDFFVVTAPCVKEAVSIAVDKLDHIADGSIHFIWSIKRFSLR